MAKNNIRSFRYSDDVEKILENFSGNSLNEKFENLVMYCYHSIPKIKNQRKAIESEIKSLENRRNDLYNTVCHLAEEVQEMQSSKRELLQIQVQCVNIRERIEKICNTIPGELPRGSDS